MSTNGFNSQPPTRLMPQHTPEMTSAQSLETATQASLRKRWKLLLPAAFVTYSLAYLDRANFGFGVAAGMTASLHITGNQTSLLGSLFFLGYFAFQLPGAAVAKRFGVSRLVFALLIAWGVFAALTGVVRTFWLLALDRVLLGIAESLIFPAMIYLLSQWFTRAERSRANMLLIVGNPGTVLWMSVLTGYLIQAYGWQKTFIIEGLPAIVWAFVWIAIVRDRPSAAGWITPRAAEILESALAKEQTAIASVDTVRKALLRHDVLLLSAQYFLWSLGIYGFVLWLPTIVRHGAVTSMGRTGLLSAVPYVAGVIAMALVAYVSDRTQRRAGLVWPFLLTGGLALLGSFLLAERSFPLAFTFLVIGGGCMYAPYGPFFAIIPERLPRNVTAEVLALINSAGALGGFVGSYFVGLLQALTGNSRAGFLLMSLALMVAAFLSLWMPASPSSESSAMLFTQPAGSASEGSAI
jgi:sugar phosphate permease